MVDPWVQDTDKALQVVPVLGDNLTAERENVQGHIASGLSNLHRFSFIHFNLLKIIRRRNLPPFIDVPSDELAFTLRHSVGEIDRLARASLDWWATCTMPGRDFL